MLALAAIIQFAADSREAQAQHLTFETGVERLNRVFIGHQFTPNLSFGRRFYSTTLGDAGGAFFWGFEGVARLPLSNGFSLSASRFVGGGGGAAQVIGDGTMLRAGLALDYKVTEAWALQLSGAWVRIDGAPIDGPAIGSGVRRQIGDQVPGAWTPRLDAELSLGATVAPTGSFRAGTVSLGVLRNFTHTRGQGTTEKGANRWAYSGGISVQQTGSNYFIGDSNTARFVVMQESSIVYFLGRNLYVTGNGQTTLHGGTAGYAVGGGACWGWPINSTLGRVGPCPSKGMSAPQEAPA